MLLGAPGLTTRSKKLLGELGYVAWSDPIRLPPHPPAGCAWQSVAVHNKTLESIAPRAGCHSHSQVTRLPRWRVQAGHCRESKRGGFGAS